MVQFAGRTDSWPGKEHVRRCGVQSRRRRGFQYRPTRRIYLATHRAGTHARRELVAEPRHRRLARGVVHGQRPLSRGETLALRGLPGYGIVVSVHYLASHAEDAVEQRNRLAGHALFVTGT